MIKEIIYDEDRKEITFWIREDISNLSDKEIDRIKSYMKKEGYIAISDDEYLDCEGDYLVKQGFRDISEDEGRYNIEFRIVFIPVIA